MLKAFKHFKASLVAILVVTVGLRIVLWAIEPFLPFVIVGLVIVSVIGVAITRDRKW